MKLYDKVKDLLTIYVDLRNSDKKLLWKVWEDLHYVHNGGLTYDSLMNADCPTFESVTRCRRKVQENCPDLQATGRVQQERIGKQKKKGMFVYHLVARPKLVFDKSRQIFIEE